MRGYGTFATFLAIALSLQVQAKTFYFPHYGDGEGLSMLFSVTNRSKEHATTRRASCSLCPTWRLVRVAPLAYGLPSLQSPLCLRGERTK